MIRLYTSRRFTADIGDHVMPISKFERVREAIEAEGLPVQLVEPSPATDEDLLRVHTETYVRAVTTGEPRELAESQKFPWSPALAQSVRWTSGGCIAAVEAALDDGVSGALASGFHHAHADHGEGFCTFNGLVVALERARARRRIQRALIVDLDLHYGNGTASLLATRPELYALSIYGSWYHSNRAHRDVDSVRAPDGANTWSVPIPNGTGGAAYLALIDQHVRRAFERARPDVVLYQAGADPYREDPYSPLDLGLDDLCERDRRVLRFARDAAVPIAWVLAGGYTKDLRKVVEAHLGTARATVEIFVRSS